MNFLFYSLTHSHTHTHTHTHTHSQKKPGMSPRFQSSLSPAVAPSPLHSPPPMEGGRRRGQGRFSTYISQVRGSDKGVCEGEGGVEPLILLVVLDQYYQLQVICRVIRQVIRRVTSGILFRGHQLVTLHRNPAVCIVLLTGGAKTLQAELRSVNYAMQSQCQNS